MANPQTENGYTAIANELLEKFYHCPLNGSEFRVCLMVIRKTYGYKKKEDWISLTQFERGTGLKRANICRTLKELVANRLLLKSKNSFRLNKNYDEWVVAKRLPSSQTGKKVVANRAIQVVAKRLHTKETLTKENIQKKEALNKFREDVSKKMRIKRI